jgi:hypothetical protein
LEGEVAEVIEQVDGNKSPAPDEFNFAFFFFKNSWGIVMGEVFRLFEEFHDSSKLRSCFHSYFVTLIPKISNPQKIGDFRSIYLLGSLYKLLEKVLVNRLGKVMDSIISRNQSKVIKGRSLAHGVVFVNEVVDFAKRTKKECVILKVDFEKAYDSVSWSVLDYMLKRVGFGAKWRD